jgi:hypothetical protein
VTADGRTVRQPLVVGADFGTLAARAAVVRASDSAEPGSGVGEYAPGAIERAVYVPGPARADVRDGLFAGYRTVHDFSSGRRGWAGNAVLHHLPSRMNGANPG